MIRRDRQETHEVPLAPTTLTLASSFAEALIAHRHICTKAPQHQMSQFTF